MQREAPTYAVATNGQPIRQKLLPLIGVLLVGAVMGLLAKVADGVPVVGEIGTQLGIWVLVATLIAAHSRSPRAAAIHVLAFFGAMLAAYYAYSTVLFGFFPRRYFIAWGSFALLSPFAAYLAWFSRGRGWFAAFCASLPIGLLISQGYTFFYMPRVAHGFSLVSAVLLFLVLPRGKLQQLRVILLAAGIAALILRLRLTSLLFGGL